jgi:hypothetical protein
MSQLELAEPHLGARSALFGARLPRTPPLRQHGPHALGAVDRAKVIAVSGGGELVRDLPQAPPLSVIGFARLSRLAIATASGCFSACADPIDARPGFKALLERIMAPTRPVARKGAGGQNKFWGTVEIGGIRDARQTLVARLFFLPLTRTGSQAGRQCLTGCKIALQTSTTRQ